MAVTPQTNISLQGIADILLQARSIALCGHVNPDGDCLGSQLTVYHALRACGKQVSCLLARDDAIDAGMRFLPGLADCIPAASYTESPDVFFALDAPNVKRIGEAAAEVQARAGVRITLDHHYEEVPMSEHNYVDPDCASTTMLAWELVALLGERTPEMAVCAYAGLMTDTGRFQFQNSSAAAFRAAAEMVEAGANPASIAREVYQSRSLASLVLEEAMLSRLELRNGGAFAWSYVTAADFERAQAVKSDIDPLIDVIRGISGVRVAALLREDGEETRGSLRAKDDTDVASVARELGGGGHRAAAGFTYKACVSKAAEELLARVDALFAAEVAKDAGGAVLAADGDVAVAVLAADAVADVGSCASAAEAPAPSSRELGLHS